MRERPPRVIAVDGSATAGSSGGAGTHGGRGGRAGWGRSSAGSGQASRPGTPARSVEGLVHADRRYDSLHAPRPRGRARRPRRAPPPRSASRSAGAAAGCSAAWPPARRAPRRDGPGARATPPAARAARRARRRRRVPPPRDSASRRRKVPSASPGWPASSCARASVSSSVMRSIRGAASSAAGSGSSSAGGSGDRIRLVGRPLLDGLLAVGAHRRMARSNGRAAPERTEHRQACLGEARGSASPPAAGRRWSPPSSRSMTSSTVRMRGRSVSPVPIQPATAPESSIRSSSRPRV